MGAKQETASSPATSPAEPIGVDESAPREEPPAAAQPSSHASAPPARSAPRPSNTDAPASSRQAAKQPAGNRITLQGLKSRPELNGCEIKIVQYIQETKRYKVSLPSGESISVKPQNLASAASVSTPKPASPELRTGSKRKLPEALGRGTGPGAESRRRMEDRRASLLSDSELEQPGSQDDPPDPLSDVLIAKRARFTASLIERAARLPATAKKRTVVTGSAKPAAKPPKPPTAGQKKPAQAQSKFHRGNQEITIDPATGATVTVNERKHLEARRRQEALNAQNNKQAASRRKSAVLVLGDRQSTERGRSKKILETHIRESRVGAFHQAKDSGEELAAEEMGGVGVGAMAGGWETSGGTHLI